MTVVTEKFIRKPLYVDAVRIDKANFKDVADWCKGEIQTVEGSTKKFIRVQAHNPINIRQTKGFVGDWILQTERGYKVYTNKAFHESFDETNGTGGADVGSEEILSAITLHEVVAMVRDGQLPVSQAAEDAQTFPREEGDVIVVGPGCFVSKDGGVLNWRGTNYVQQTQQEEEAA